MTLPMSTGERTELSRPNLAPMVVATVARANDVVVAARGRLF